MVYAVIKDGNQIEILEEEDFSADKNEEYLHKLIETNPYIISKEITENNVVTLGSKLRLPSGGELDLLLLDSNGNIVLVELKRGEGHRKAIAQLLDYASELQEMSIETLFDSSGIKFQSLNDVYNFFRENFREEILYDEFEENVKNCLNDHRSLLLLLVSYKIGEDTARLVNWLRKFGVDIKCIEFSYFKRRKKEEKEIFVPKLVGVEEIKPLKQKKITQIQEKYLRFFTEILSRFKEIKPGITERKALPDSWLHIPAGYNAIHFEWYFTGREPEKNFGIALHFEHQDEEENEKFLKYFESRKKEIEDKIGDKLYFGKFAKKWREICIERRIKTLDEALADEELKSWAVDTMVKLYDTLKPMLDEAVREIRG